MTNKILKTENELYGFWGTTAINYNQKETQKRWNIVFKTLIELSGAEPEKVRELLDSRSGRYFADQCYKQKDIEQITKENYFKWLDRELFEDENSKKSIETEKSTKLFGTRVYNTISDRADIILYTYKNENRVHKDYAVCIDVNQNKYRIGVDYIKPVEDMDEEELIRCGLK